MLCYAPADSASAEYLKRENGALVAVNRSELQNGLSQLIRDPALRTRYADRAKQLGLKNHNRETTAAYVRQEIEAL